MKISTLISALAGTLESQGDLDVCFCTNDAESKTLKAANLLQGGIAPLGEGGKVVAWVSTEDLTEFFNGKQPMA